ncbi:hypothetical protein EVAR_28155_1 [Eumeta japonica]|uniref:Uncharacterized protein n=1 Tax=Eumeta variegata TaxID=151549 RepID=A0A4C1VFQ8_EUMVA|nr:hypothetical protein EVAR_28155_1 [Eumeta japonica]
MFIYSRPSVISTRAAVGAGYSGSGCPRPRRPSAPGAPAHPAAGLRNAFGVIALPALLGSLIDSPGTEIKYISASGDMPSPVLRSIPARSCSDTLSTHTTDSAPVLSSDPVHVVASVGYNCNFGMGS